MQGLRRRRHLRARAAAQCLQGLRQQRLPFRDGRAQLAERRWRAQRRRTAAAALASAAAGVVVVVAREAAAAAAAAVEADTAIAEAAAEA